MSTDAVSVPAVELRDVCKKFGATEIIRGVNLSIPRGERHAIIGPNGAGKTTLFKMIMGMEQPTGGTLRIGDTVSLSYVDQTRDALNPDKTVYEEVSDGRDFIEIGKDTDWSCIPIELPPRELRLALFQEGQDAFEMIMGCGGFVLRFGLEVERLGEGGPGRPSERALDEPDRDGRELGQASRELDRLLQEGAARHHTVDQADRLRGRRIDPVGEDRELERLRPPNRAWQQVGGARVGHKADLDERQYESG